MAEITKHRTGSHLRALFAILLKHPEGMQARDALAELESTVQLTPYEQGYYDSGARRFEKIVRFATVDCVKAGWLQKQKGRWTVTQEGQAAWTKYQAPGEFYGAAVSLYRKWKASQPTSDDDEQEEETEAEKAIAVTIEEADESAWAEIEQYLRDMNPYESQDLVGALLRALAYHIAWTAPPGRDGGIDLIASPDPLGTRSPRLKVQVKRQVASVNVEGLRSFMAMLGHDDVGLFVSLGGFTKDAMDEARSQQTRKVTLIDLERFFDLWVEHYPRLPDEDKRRLPLKPVYFLAPD